MYLDAAAAIIPEEKLREYLLSRSHPIGRYKAPFFESVGYKQEECQVLERDLRALLINPASAGESNGYGQKFVVRGRIQGPNGSVAGIVTVWIILMGETSPRFVTAYPED